MPRRKGRVIPFTLPEESAEEALRRRLSPRGTEINLTQRRWLAEEARVAEEPERRLTQPVGVRGVTDTIGAWLSGKRKRDGNFTTDGKYVYSYKLPLARHYPSGAVYVIMKPDSSPTTAKHYNTLLAMLSVHGIVPVFVRTASDFPLHNKE